MMLTLIILLVLLLQICVLDHNAVNGKGHHRQNVTQIQSTTSRGRLYDPNHGYEPYWPGGQWVQSENPDVETTLPPPQACGKDCHYLHQAIKHVCARDIDNAYYSWNWWYNTKIDNLVKGYKTFDTYCEFLDQKCATESKTRPKINKWIYVHLGKCETDQSLTFKTMFEKEPITRMQAYLKAMNETFKKHTVTPC